MGLIRHLDDFLNRVFCCDLCFDCDGFEAGFDSVYFEEASSVPRSSYGCFQKESMVKFAMLAFLANMTFSQKPTLAMK